MPPLPKKKHTPARKGGRSAHHFLQPASLSKCPACNAVRLPHRVCPECGYYGPAGKGRYVITEARTEPRSGSESPSS